MVDACEIGTAFSRKVHSQWIWYPGIWNIFAYSCLIIWPCICRETDWNLYLLENLWFIGVKPLSARNFYVQWLKNWALRMWRRISETEIIRPPCTVFLCVIIEFVVDRLAVGQIFFRVLLFSIVICYSTDASHSVHCHPCCVGQILTELVNYIPAV